MQVSLVHFPWIILGQTEKLMLTLFPPILGAYKSWKASLWY